MGVNKKLLGLLAGSAFYSLSASIAHALVIDFEDLTTRNNFNALGIIDTYQGFEWGFGTSPGVAGRTFVNTSIGWASATVTDPGVAPAPTGVGGESYAWNWGGPQSLWIDFKSPTNFIGGDFAVLSSTFGSNASTLQLFTYDSTDKLVGASAILNLTDTFQSLSANFTNVRYLELRANTQTAWFSIDNLVVDQAQVPEPTTLVLMALGLAGFGYRGYKSA